MRKDHGTILLLILLVLTLFTGAAAATSVEIVLIVDGVSYKVDEIDATTLSLVMDVVKAEFEIDTAYYVFARMTALVTEAKQDMQAAYAEVAKSAKASLDLARAEAVKAKRVLTAHCHRRLQKS